MKRSDAVTVRKIAWLGMLFALSLVFSLLESMIVIPGMPPGVKLGLSNLVVMYCLFIIGSKSAYTLACLKGLFVFLIRGPVSAVLSLSGGLISVTVMALGAAKKKQPLSYLSLSILGAVSHNLGQLFAARFIINALLYYYIPILIVAGVGVGVLTGVTFGYLLPYLNR